MSYVPVATRSEIALRLAAAAVADPRTALRYLAGERPRGRVAERLDMAARELGITPGYDDGGRAA